MTGWWPALLACSALLVLLRPDERRLREVVRGRQAAGSARRPAGPPSWMPARAGSRDRADGDVPLLLDLVAAALAAGSTPAAALEVVGRGVGGVQGEQVVRVAGRLRLGSDWEGAWTGTDAGLAPLRRCLGLALGTGAPAAELLRSAATEARRRRARAAQLEAARLGVRLVLPLGLCALPGFLLLGVVPVVLSLAGRVLTLAP